MEQKRAEVAIFKFCGVFYENSRLLRDWKVQEKLAMFCVMAEK